MSDAARELGDRVVEACLAMGFALAGIAPAEPTARRAEYLRWLGAGMHGEMGYLEEGLEERLDVRRLLPGARAVVMVADQYAVRGAREQEGEDDPAMGRVAKYARGRDYHAVIKRRLHALCDRLREMRPDAAFRSFTDTAPVMEREHAARAGLGFVGKHTLMIHPRVGSYLLLGGVATTLELRRTDAKGERDVGEAAVDHCGTCTLCIEACPTGAIEPYRVNATRCVSYLTLEHRGAIDPALHAGVGDRLIGCDVCQDVCPFNREHEGERTGGNRVNPAYAHDAGLRARLPILEVLGWAEEDRCRVMGSSAGKRASLVMLRRNAAVAAGNALVSGRHPELAKKLIDLAADEGEDGLIRDTARRALGRSA